ncbi:MAG: Asp-tRNA(Asn)/Glu-tRNA(Gln) amidotransferase GatCAB subunit A, partial [Denitrobacterium sp.]|nr:Asp-tRNA(Asn)/Glu-tRNA(Gln) amidotransferase GatCAB subunit A [Denitrobacterium sp.]
MEFGTMDIAAIRSGLAAKEFSAREVAEQSLARIDAVDGTVNAFLEVTPEAALAKADEVDAAIAAGAFDELGPLAGVPVAFKDNMNLAGTHTTCASHMLENYVSPYTATCVQRAIDAGALPLGKLNMDEFAFGSTT